MISTNFSHFNFNLQPWFCYLLPSMFEGKAVIGETDMLQAMQQDALHLAAKALDFYDVTDLTQIARVIKKEFDRAYGGGWQCIVGTDFGSYVTHCYGNFIYFCVGSLAILLFRSFADPESSIDDDEINQFAKLAIHTVEA